MSIVAIKECGFDISGFLKINLNKFFNDKLLQAGRGRVITLDDTTKLIDDSYNASPLSMQNALSTLRYYDGTKLAIIGDMLELGDIAIREHFELVDHLANIDNVIVIGHLMKNLSDEMQKRGKKCEYYENVDSFLAHFDTNYHKLLTFLKKINVILVKSSNSIKLSRIIDFIDQNNGNES